MGMANNASVSFFIPASISLSPDMESAAANPIWKQISLYTNKGTTKRSSIHSHDPEYPLTLPLSINVIDNMCAKLELDMCLWNMDAPGSNKVKIWQNLKVHVLHFDPAPPPGAWDVS